MRRFIFILVISIFIFFTFTSCNDSTNPISPNGDQNNLSSNSLDLNKKSLPNNKFIKVFRTGGLMDIDGEEAEWDNVPKHKMRKYYVSDNANVQKFLKVKKNDLSAYFKLLWDDQNLYVFVNIYDDQINVNPVTLPPYFKDSFEIFMDGDNSKNEGSYDSNDDQVRFVWQEDPFSARGNYDVDRYEYAYSQSNKGWNLEIRIPFSALVDFIPEPKKVFGIEFHINDNDNDERQNFLKWWSDSDLTFLYPSLFGSAYLFNSVAN